MAVPMVGAHLGGCLAVGIYDPVLPAILAQRPGRGTCRSRVVAGESSLPGNRVLRWRSGSGGKAFFTQRSTGGIGGRFTLIEQPALRWQAALSWYNRAAHGYIYA